MAERITQTRGGDAPLSSANNPDARAAGLDVDVDGDGDELVGRTVSINRPRQELYEFWRDVRNLPLFMENIESVTVLEGGRSHWVVRWASWWGKKMCTRSPSSGAGGASSRRPNSDSVTMYGRS